MDVNPDVVDPRSGASPDGEIVLSGTGITLGEALAEAIAKMDWAGALAAAGIVPDNSPQLDDFQPVDSHPVDFQPVDMPADDGPLDGTAGMLADPSSSDYLFLA